MSAGSGRWRGSSSAQGRSSSLPFRGGRRGSYPSQRRTQIVSQIAARPPSPPLGQLLATLSDVDLTDPSDLYEYPAKISSCKDVASYNWLNEQEPTILVPGLQPLCLTYDTCNNPRRQKKKLTPTKGKPPAWAPPPTTTKLKEDNGNYFRDPNAARYPAHPIEPAVQAIYASQPDFPTTSIDLFACGSTLGNLLRFVRKVDKSFRILVEAVGDTVFFVRRENSPTELIPGVTGFGHTFPDAYTTWETEVKRSVSHQRIIRYELGGLDCIVRFEADGYHKDLVSRGSEVGQRVDPPEADNSKDTLASALSNSAIDDRLPTRDKPLNVIHGGQKIPRAAVFDLKTRSVRKKDQDTLGEELPRLWLAQLSNFILAYHTSGIFEEIQIRDIRHDVEDWERENRDMIRRFAVLLRKIVAFARSTADRKIEVRSSEVNVLELREQTGDASQTLPAVVEARWIDGNVDGSNASSDESHGPDMGTSAEPEDGHDSLDWDEGSEKDYTACSEDCGYCGQCSY